MKTQEPSSVFGLWEYPSMVTKINRLLKPHGLKLKVTKNYRQWGDQVQVEVVKRTDS